MDPATDPDAAVVRERDLVDRDEIVTNLDRPPLLSWGAIVGGLVFVIAASWLLYLLGAALGVSIADGTDGEAIGSGLAMGATIWIVLSSLVVYFLGSMLTARLSGKVDSFVGMLHGLILWSVATTLIIYFSYVGVSNLLQTGYSVAKDTVTAAASATSNTTAMVSNVATEATTGDSMLADNIQARLKRRASAVIARVDADGGAEVTAAEVRQAIDDMSTADLKKIANHITAGEMTAAREKLVSGTGLSDKEVREIIDGIANEFEKELGTADNNKSLVTDISNAVKRQTSDYVADMDAAGGPEVSQGDIRKAMNQVSPEIMQTVAYRIANGNVRGAKDSLAANTNLTSRQVNDIVEGVNEDVSRTVEKYKREANEIAEAATTYSQAVLWTVFAAGAMGLAVSLLGGWMGAESSRRIYVEQRRDMDLRTD